MNNTIKDLYHILKNRVNWGIASDKEIKEFESLDNYYWGDEDGL